MNNISPHITYAEATRSQTAERFGISNAPKPEQIEAMQLVAERCFEPAREHFGVPLAVSSFFRSPRLNAAIGGAPGSQHCTGQAIDIDADTFGGLTNRDLFEFLRAGDFDQLIWEFGTTESPAWVHVSYRATGNRRMVLRARTVAGHAMYEPYQSAIA
jgi:hypothetical protein